MWIILAVITFIAGQVYLFHCLGKLDRFMNRNPVAEPDNEVLSIAFSDSATVDHLTDLLEHFSASYPNIDITLLTGPNVLDAVYKGQAAVGFVPAEHHAYAGLHSLPLCMNTTQIFSSTGLRITPLDNTTEQEIIWKRSVFSSPAETFIRYLLDQGVVGSRNTK